MLQLNHQLGQSAPAPALEHVPMVTSTQVMELLVMISSIKDMELVVITSKVMELVVIITMAMELVGMITSWVRSWW